MPFKMPFLPLLYFWLHSRQRERGVCASDEENHPYVRCIHGIESRNSVGGCIMVFYYYSVLENGFWLRRVLVIVLARLKFNSMGL